MKAETSKKRANDSATKTPVSSKKAKKATPQKTGIFLIFFYGDIEFYVCFNALLGTLNSTIFRKCGYIFPLNIS